ncbi:MAG: rod shape-determining protein MreC [Treponemataceae bacterium]|nr:rod shape-determining protein MreC [Treponemataceae bacterium]
MADQRKHTNSRFSLVVFVAYLVFSNVMLALSSGGFVVNFQQLGFSVLSSVQKGVHTVTSSVSDFFTSISKLANLQNEYDILVEKLANYEYLQRDNAEVRKENERLRQQLGFSESVSYTNFSAQIIARDSNSTFSGITIDKGARQGVVKGMPVIAIQNGKIGLVGRIISVGQTTSMILPIFDYQCNVSGRIEATRDVGIVTGNGDVDQTLTMKYVKKRLLSELNYGDVIVTSGENDNYLRDIPIGTVTQINIRDYDSSLEVLLTPIIDFDRLETVLIVDLRSESGGGK